MYRHTHNNPRLSGWEVRLDNVNLSLEGTHAGAAGRPNEPRCERIALKRNQYQCWLDTVSVCVLTILQPVLQVGAHEHLSRGKSPIVWHTDSDENAQFCKWSRLAKVQGFLPGGLIVGCPPPAANALIPGASYLLMAWRIEARAKRTDHADVCCCRV